MSSHPGTSNWQSQMPSHSATPNWQPPIPSHPYDAGLLNPADSIYKNKVKNANVSPLNLGNAFADDNVGGDDVMFLGEHDIGNYLVYENVDPSKVMREDYIDCMEFLLNPYDVYLDCHMMSYMVPDYFWRQLVPHLCMAGSHSLERPNQEGWLSGDHMNAWIEQLIRERTQNANRIVSKSGTICVQLENKRFMIQTDQHIIGTLDGSTRPYPAWNDVDWVYMPINAGGNHWVTDAVNLPNSLFDVFDSMHSEGTRLMLEQQTPVINGILQSRGCFNGTGRQSHNFLFIYNDGLGHTVPQQPNFKDCGVITCWLIAKLCSDQPPIVHGDSQAFWENIRYQMLQMFYKCRSVGMDGNNQIVPIAFGIYKGETGPCWSWWMSVLKECIGDNTNLLFISDRHPAIALAVHMEFPLAFHVAYTPEEFASNMSILQVVQPDAYHKLCEAGPQTWSRAHCPLVRYNYMTSNSVESVNACGVINRKLPVLKLAETYRAMVQDWYYKRRELAVAEDGVADIKRRRRDLSSDDVRNLATASRRGRLIEDLESSTW
ncbi:transposase, MuDR, MULE transposase domain protein [Tanacetum coccineum]